MEGSITKLALILYNSVEYIMQGRMPKNSLIIRTEFSSTRPVILDFFLKKRNFKHSFDYSSLIH